MTAPTCQFCNGTGVWWPEDSPVSLACDHAPTLPEPRPDDEGRNTLMCEDSGYSCGQPATVQIYNGLCGWQTWCRRHAPALTPHPAPLGATRSMTPEEVESQKAFRRSVSRPLGATDEGLRAAATRALRHLDGLMQLGGIDGIAEHNVKLAVAALRAALHTTKEAPRAE